MEKYEKLSLKYHQIEQPGVLSTLYHRVRSSMIIYIDRFTLVYQRNAILSNKVVLVLLLNLTPYGICNFGG